MVFDRRKKMETKGTDIGEKTEFEFRDFKYDKSKSNGSKISIGEVHTKKGKATIEVKSNYIIGDDKGKVYGYSDIRAGGGYTPFGIEVKFIGKPSFYGITEKDIRKEIEKQCLNGIEEDIKAGYYPE
jgi:hypothetical protein